MSLMRDPKNAAFVFVILMGLLIIAIPNNAQACSCIANYSPIDSLDSSDSVFLGKVMNLDGIPGENKEFAGDDYVLVTFEVSRVWKGELSTNVIVSTALEGATCGLGRSFTIGEEYIVYAGGDEGELMTHLCTRTAHVSNAQEDIAALNSLGTEGPSDPSPPPGTSIQGFLINYSYLVLGSVGVTTALIFSIRKYLG